MTELANRSTASDGEESSRFLLLGYAGLLPFIAAAVMNWTTTELMGLTGLTIFAAYSAIILSFMAGTLWGRVIDSPEPLLAKPKVLVVSNVFALLAWLSILATQQIVALWLLLFGYVMLLVIERRHLDEKAYAVTAASSAQQSGDSVSELRCERYRNMRLTLTTVVAVLHVSVLLA